MRLHNQSGLRCGCQTKRYSLKEEKPLKNIKLHCVCRTREHLVRDVSDS